jgi:myosin heavy subunit
VRHYAGQVAYSAVGFLDKNRDLFSKNLSQLCADATNGTLSGLFVVSAESDKKESKSQSPTTGGAIIADNYFYIDCSHLSYLTRPVIYQS